MFYMQDVHFFGTTQRQKMTPKFSFNHSYSSFYQSLRQQESIKDTGVQIAIINKITGINNGSSKKFDKID